MKKTMILAAAFGVLSTPVLAKSAEQMIQSDLLALGYSQIEIDHDDGEIEVEANRGHYEYEMTYSRAGLLMDFERDDRDDD